MNPNKIKRQLYRRANWRIKLLASDYAQASLSAFGGNLWAPLAADFDGDGKADPAIWQASAATLSVKLSASGYAVTEFVFLAQNQTLS